MPEPDEQRIEQAATAAEQEIVLFVHDTSPKVIKALLGNRNLTEEHALIIAGRKNIPPEILEAIFKDKRWSESYPVRMALAKNPKTPLFTAISVARFLRLFDQAALARDSQLPVIFRKKMEALVIEKIPTLALGVKKTLAKTAAGDILLSLMKDGYPEIVRICLDNPHLVEAHLYKIINLTTTTPGMIRTIADHRAWTARYHVKFALIRNEHTPLARSVLFLPSLQTRDLKELYRDPHLPSGVRPFIHRELIERGENADELRSPEEEPVFEIREDDMSDIENNMELFREAGKENTDRTETSDAQDGTAPD